MRSRSACKSWRKGGITVLIEFGTIIVLIYFAVSIGLTILIELPIIRCFKITNRNLFIMAVNSLTNVIFNLGLALMLWWLAVHGDGSFIMAVIGYVAFAEFYVIPFSESELYRRISDKSKGQILKASYVANIASFVLGIVFDYFFLANIGRWF